MKSLNKSQLSIDGNFYNFNFKDFVNDTISPLKSAVTSSNIGKLGSVLQDSGSIVKSLVSKPNITTTQDSSAVNTTDSNLSSPPSKSNKWIWIGAGGGALIIGIIVIAATRKKK